MKTNLWNADASIVTIALLLSSCGQPKTTGVESPDSLAATPAFLSQPLISHIYTADPSAHVFNEHIYI